MTREQEIQARVISPSIEDIKRAVQSCLRMTTAHYCEGCYLHALENDFLMSSGKYCFAHLALEVATQFDRLTAENEELRMIVKREKVVAQRQIAKSQELEAERDHLRCCGNCDYWIYKYQQCEHPDQRADEAGAYDKSPTDKCELWEWACGLRREGEQG